MPAAMVDRLCLGIDVAVENRRLGLIQFVQNARAGHTGERLTRPDCRNHHRGSGETQGRHQKLPSFHFILQ